MIQVRMIRWGKFYASVEHRDIDITDIALWEPPGGGWMVTAISTTDNGLPPWEEKEVKQ